MDHYIIGIIGSHLVSYYKFPDYSSSGKWSGWCQQGNIPSKKFNSELTGISFGDCIDILDGIPNVIAFEILEEELSLPIAELGQVYPEKFI